jgi:hypothetical protein
MSGGGWVLLGERPREEIALGLVGKFWRPVIEYAQVDAATFKEFAEPGFAKTIYALGTRPTEDGETLLWAIMRTATTGRSRPHLVSPLLDLRGRLRRTRARSRTARHHPRRRRASAGNLTDVQRPRMAQTRFQ